MTNADDEMSPSDRILMNSLAHAIGTPQLPPDLLDRCEGLLSWIDVDAELAMLLDRPVAEAAGTRGAASDTPTLVFSVGDGELVIELDASPAAVRGQLLGGDARAVILRTAGGAGHPIPVDETGVFSLENPPSGTIRLELELFSESRRIHTDWFVV